MKDTYRSTFNRIDLTREVLALRYMMTSILVNTNNILFYLEGKEKAMYQFLSEEGKKKIKRTIHFKDEIEFNMFKVSGRYYNALCKKFGVENVTNATILLDTYLKDNLNKQLSQPQINKKLKEYTTRLSSQDEINKYLAKAIEISSSVDYKLIDDITIARQYIAGVPYYMRSLDEGVQYLKEKFNL